MRKIFIVGFPVLALLWLSSGCTNKSNPVAPSVPQSEDTTFPGGYGYVLDGSAFSRSSALMGTQAFASVDTDFGLGVPPGSSFLSINLNYNEISFSNFHTRAIALMLPFTNPKPGTFTITQWDDPANAQAFILADSFEYDCLAGGTLTITRFDTVNNLVSGTFAFTAAQAKPTADATKIETVTNGYFHDVGIYVGSYGQGTVTAVADGQPFTTNFGSRKMVSAFVQSGTTMLTIEAFDSLSQSLLITIDNPGLGTFQLPQSQSILPTPSYSGPDGTVSGGSGSLTITEYDPTARRLSGSFHFSGTDQTTGNTIQITNGVIYNIQWSVL